MFCWYKFTGILFFLTTSSLGKRKFKESAEYDFYKEYQYFRAAAMQEMYKEWFDIKKYPEVILTNEQWTWFHSLTFYHQPRNSSEFGTDHFSESRGWRKTREACDIVDVPYLQRKEWRRMSSAMRQSYIDAVNALAKFLPDPNDEELRSAYDIFVLVHRFSMAPGAHLGAAFLPWHREYLWRYSNALRQQGYTGDLPFWDSMLDQPLPDPADSALFTDENMGNVRGTFDAPFHDLEPLQICGNSNSSLYRDSNYSPEVAKLLLYRQEKLDVIFNYTCFRDLGAGWNSELDESFESFHDAIHVFFGGMMGNVPCASSDPVFSLHHTFIDLLWEEFRHSSQTSDLAKEYPLTQTGHPDINEELYRFMNWDSLMRPFNLEATNGMRNIEGLSLHYTTYYYQYDIRPSTIQCSKDEDCSQASDLLFCFNKQCLGKVQDGGMCDINLPDRQCWCADGKQPVCEQDIIEHRCTCI